jgi:hypothetical protein
MNPILAALVALPKIASSIETLAAMVGQLNKELARVEAAKRRGRKDDEVDEAIAKILARRDAPDGVRGDDET